MEKKYRILYENKITYKDTRTKGLKDVYQIEALKDMPSIHVKKGDLGGYVEDETNLSHEDDCWIFKDGVVASGSLVAGNALIYEEATILDGSRVFDNAVIKFAHVTNSFISGDSKIETATIENCTFFNKSYLDMVYVKNITTWDLDMVHSTLNPRSSLIWTSASCELIDTEFVHKGRRRKMVWEHPLKMEHSKLTDIHLFTLKSPVHMKNVRAHVRLKFSALECQTSRYTNKLVGDKELMLTKDTWLVIKDSSIEIDGHLFGYLRFDLSQVKTFGYIENHSHKCLSLTRLEMSELSRLTNHKEIHIENLVLQGEDNYTC
ncbi:hypothetical protein JMA_44020 (plasmid) [Jeotgalibacillus malaysiensis]|uniref:Uncharacterized protein n=1 Tax=Jeotgalibacillus malaysiensis TaxID=1508404 RepID=A0A0B5B0P6_9BACL|nr:hypothetical protein [Jeotgalibacillus malaysiensis]AJD93719.1 hypothetical protein JMA_44020 [Jeotgalibacillus malaysiensis]